MVGWCVVGSQRWVVPRTCNQRRRRFGESGLVDEWLNGLHEAEQCRHRTRGVQIVVHTVRKLRGEGEGEGEKEGEGEGRQWRSGVVVAWWRGGVVSVVVERSSQIKNAQSKTLQNDKI